MRRAFLICGLLYVLIYAFEGAVRYGLHLAHADDAIFARDALLWFPCLGLLAVQATRLRVHPAFFVFGAVIAVHGGLIYANMHAPGAVLYGAKILMAVLFGFFAGELLANPSRGVTRLLGWVLVATLAGIVLDKFVLSYPWEGMTTHIGDLTVDISRDWQTGNGMAKRVAGFTRSSIEAAVLVPVLTLLLLPRIRNWLARLVVMLAGLAAVFFTTQKGAVIGMFVPCCILLLPRRWCFRLLAITGVVFALLAVLLPVLSDGMVISDSGGVFSLGSFGMRIMLTWPDAWQWIGMHQIFPLGVGLGGIGGAQRLYALNYVNPADNLFVFLYAWFGVMGLVYFAWTVALPWRVPKAARERMLPGLSVLVYLLGYGAVISVIENPLCALYLGASAGAMWNAAQAARRRRWADAFDPGPSPMLPTQVREEAVLPAHRSA